MFDFENVKVKKIKIFTKISDTPVSPLGSAPALNEMYALSNFMDQTLLSKVRGVFVKW